MKRTRLIYLNNKKIIFCDLTNARNEDIIDASNDTWQLFSTEIKEGEKLSFLINITNLDIAPSIMEEIALMAEKYKKNIDKEGIIGLHGIKKTLFNFYGLVIGAQLKAFDNQEKAFNWLAS